VNGNGGESSSSPRLLENGWARPRVAQDAVESGEARVPFIGANGGLNGQKRMCKTHFYKNKISCK
jgi:hypothetical protein